VPSLLLVHGAGGGGWEWQAWARVFTAAGWQVAAPDLQPAPAGLAQTHLDDYRGQVRDALAALPRPRASAGASLGGLLALACAGDADALVLVNPLPPAPWHAQLPAAPRGDAVVRWGARASLAGTRAAMPDARPGDAWFAFRRWRDESGAVLDAARAGIECALPSCPTWVLASASDEDVPCAISQRVAEGIGADFHRLEDASHVGPLIGRHAVPAAMRALTWLNVKFA